MAHHGYTCDESTPIIFSFARTTPGIGAAIAALLVLRAEEYETHFVADGRALAWEIHDEEERYRDER